MPHMNRLDYKGWYYCPAHAAMECWSLGSCIATVPAYLWDDLVENVPDTVLNPVASYSPVDHGPDPITIR